MFLTQKTKTQVFNFFLSATWWKTPFSVLFVPLFKVWINATVVLWRATGIKNQARESVHYGSQKAALLIMTEWQNWGKRFACETSAVDRIFPTETWTEKSEPGYVEHEAENIWTHLQQREHLNSLQSRKCCQMRRRPHMARLQITR